MSDLISRDAVIKALENCYCGGEDSCGEHWIYEAHAIKAVEQLPPIQPDNNSEKPNSSDSISRQAAINAIDECYCGGEDSCGEPWIYKENAVEAIQMIEPILPETAKRIIGKSRGGMTLWYQCNVCNEPVDEKDAYCRGCGRRLIHE